MQSCKSSIESDVVMLIPLYAECKIDTFFNNGGTPSTSMTEVALNSAPTPAYLKIYKFKLNDNFYIIVTSIILVIVVCSDCMQKLE